MIGMEKVPMRVCLSDQTQHSLKGSLTILETISIASHNGVVYTGRAKHDQNMEERGEGEKLMKTGCPGSVRSLVWRKGGRQSGHKQSSGAYAQDRRILE